MNEKNVILYSISLAIEFQFIQRQQRLQEAVPEALGDDNSVPAALEGQQNLQRQPPPRRNADLINALMSLFNKSISVIIYAIRLFSNSHSVLWVGKIISISDFSSRLK